jgi:hypothetical protein
MNVAPRVASDPRPPGPVLFARYAFGPNRLGLCGPDDWQALLGLAGVDDQGSELRSLARGFEGAWPYLELLAHEVGIADPLDRRVVSAYWLGTDLGAGVSEAALGESLETRFRRRMPPASWRWLAGKPEAGARPVHAFHVLDVFPRAGLMRGGDAGDVLRVMDSCRIRWGRVLEVPGEQLVVAAPRLEMVDGRLRIGAAQVETVRRSLGGVGFVDEIAPGDIVSIHWDWACDRLDPVGLSALVRSTEHQLGIANQTI